MLWLTAVNEVVARRACINLFNTYRKEVVDILLQVVYTRVPRKSFWLCKLTSYKLSNYASYVDRIVDCLPNITAAILYESGSSSLS